MNRSRLFMIAGLALALGLLVSYAVYNRLLTSSAANNEPGVDIVVAANDLQVGAKLEDHDVRLARFAQSVIPSGAFTKKTQGVGPCVVLPVTKRQFILPTNLTPPNPGPTLHP